MADRDSPLKVSKGREVFMKVSEPETSQLRYIKGVGPKRSLVFEKIGIRTVRDLLYLFPRRYEDRSHFAPLDALPFGEPITCRGEVLDVKFKPIRGMPLVEVLIGDAAGTLRAVWFNQPYLKKIFECGQQVILYGKVELYQKHIQMSNPEFEIVDGPAAGLNKLKPPIGSGIPLALFTLFLKEYSASSRGRNVRILPAQ